jgi:hypothetical protein
VSNRIPAVSAMLVLPAILAASALGQQGRSEEVNAEGVVVAVQLDPGAARSAMEVNSESMGDFAEVWMVRVDRSVSPNSTKYILVEYAHVNRHEPFVTDSELDSSRLEVQPTSCIGRQTRNLCQLGRPICSYGVRQT